MASVATIGRNVRALREGRFTQESLARELGVSWITVNRLERGIGKSIKPDRLHDLAEVLGVNISDLLEDAA